MEAESPVCPLCLRPLPPDVPQSDHHLIPKLRGGKGGPVVRLHHRPSTQLAVSNGPQGSPSAPGSSSG